MIKNRMKLCLFLVSASLLFIWGNSLLPASVSGALSGWVRDLLGLLNFAEEGAVPEEGILRKIAHFLEFCLLGSLLCWLFGMLREKRRAFWLPALGCGCLAACMDEMLQHFSEGRAPKITDVFIDISGLVLGIILFITGYYVCRKRKN